MKETINTEEFLDWIKRNVPREIELQDCLHL